MAFAYVTAALIPADYWYDAGELYVNNYNQGENTELFHDGGAVQDFNGSYSIVVRDTDNSIVVETNSGVFPYRVDAKRPVPLLMDWWAPSGAERIFNLEPGLYTLTTCWTVHEPFYGLTGNKATCTKSNVFHVFGSGEIPER